MSDGSRSQGKVIGWMHCERRRRLGLSVLSNKGFRLRWELYPWHWKHELTDFMALEHSMAFAG